jgi:hypothetical protein
MASGMEVDVVRIAILCLLIVGCAAAASKPSTERVLEQLTGKPISEFIEKHHAYPDSSDVLPSGNKVYRFSRGSGAHVDQWGNVTSRVCLVWIETNPSDIVVRWRYENCT